MPTVHSMELPLPKNWQDFETIVCDAMGQRWKSTDLQKHGRSGQKQDGVDIWGSDEIGRRVAIQCKRYKDALKLVDVTGEVAKAEKFAGKLTTLFVATTTGHDAKLQQQVRLLSDTRVAQGKFSVALLFWDDIVAGLQLNPNVFQAHYPQISLDGAPSNNNERLIAAAELGYWGADLWAAVELIYGEFGQMAQADPDELIAKLRIVERRAQQLLRPADADPILEAIAEVRTGCLADKKTSSDWDPVQVYAKRVSSRLKSASSMLPLGESNALDLGLQLGRIYYHSDDLPPLTVRRGVQSKVRTVLPEAREDAVKAKFASVRKLKSGYQWAERIYSFVDHELRYRA